MGLLHWQNWCQLYMMALDVWISFQLHLSLSKNHFWTPKDGGEKLCHPMVAFIILCLYCSCLWWHYTATIQFHALHLPATSSSEIFITSPLSLAHNSTHINVYSQSYTITHPHPLTASPTGTHTHTQMQPYKLTHSHSARSALSDFCAALRVKSSFYLTWLTFTAILIKFEFSVRSLFT
jgi:hypothetical protein